jgi:hypothetical protein
MTRSSTPIRSSRVGSAAIRSVRTENGLNIVAPTIAKTELLIQTNVFAQIEATVNQLLGVLQVDAVGVVVITLGTEILREMDTMFVVRLLEVLVVSVVKGHRFRGHWLGTMSASESLKCPELTFAASTLHTRAWHIYANFFQWTPDILSSVTLAFHFRVVE